MMAVKRSTAAKINRKKKRQSPLQQQLARGRKYSQRGYGKK